MFEISVRVRPCRAAAFGVTDSCRSTTMWSLSIFAVTPRGILWESFPFGPSTFTRSPVMATFTPWEILMGCLPTRDILPNLAKDLAADFRLPSFRSRHHAFRRRDDRDTRAAERTRERFVSRITTKSWPGNTLNALDHRCAVVGILQINLDHRNPFIARKAEVFYVTFLFQYANDVRLQTGSRNFDFLVSF